MDNNPPALARACEHAIASGDWTTLCTIAALDKAVVRWAVGKALAAACLPNPLEAPVAVANVQALVAHGVVQDMLRDNQFVASSAFMLAIDNGHVTVVQALVGGGAELSTWILDAWSLLRYAVRRNNVEITEYLLSVNASMDRPPQEDRLHATDVLAPAILNKNKHMLELLVRAGAKHGWAEAAVAENDFDMVEFLIAQGLDPSNVNEDGESVLHIAVRTGRLALAERLLSDGYDPHVVDKKGRTLMHVVQSLEAFELLHAKRVSVHAVDEDGQTPLHACCMRHGFVGVPKAMDSSLSVTHSLMEPSSSHFASPFYQCRGTTVQGRRCKITRDLDLLGYCKFHDLVPFRVGGIAASPRRLALLLVRQCRGTITQGVRCGMTEELDVHGFCKYHQPLRRAVVDVDVLDALLNHGAARDVNKLDKVNNGPLHYLLQDVSVDCKVGSYGDPVTRLLKAGANVVTLSGKNSPSPLLVLLRRLSLVVSQGYLHLLRLLCEHGAVWDSECDAVVQFMENAGARRVLNHPGSHTEEDSDLNTTICYYRAARVCVQHWMEAKSSNQELMEIPFEVFATGEESLQEYLHDLASARNKWRRKICVLGPSECGKTAVVTSLLAGKVPSPVQDDDTASRLGISEHSFEEPETGRVHHVVLWDIRAHDVDRSIPSIAFTKRTLFVLCIDLELYAEHLDKSDHEKRRFAHECVLRWVEMTADLAYSPEFFVVGTKLDKLKAGSVAVQAVWDDLQDRIKECDLLQPVVFPPRGGVFAADRDSAISFSGFIALSNTNEQSVIDAREQQLISFLIDSRKSRSFQMTERLMKAVEFVEERRAPATRNGQAISNQGPVVELEQACEELQKRSGSTNDLRVHLLPTLHQLGEIVWRQGSSSAGPKNHFVFDAMVAVKMVQEVAGHNYVESTDRAGVQRLQDEGYLSDKELVQGNSWSCMNGDQKLVVKTWLMELSLAYPANGGCMQSDSDLIVPAYWTNSQAKCQLLCARSSVAAQGNAALEWLFEVPAAISTEVLKKFAVRCSRLGWADRVSWSKGAAAIIVQINDDTKVYVVMEASKTERWDMLRIYVGSTSEERAVPWLQYYVLTMESVLDTYLRYHVERRIVQSDGQGVTVCAIQDELEDGYERPTWPRNCSDLTWYGERHDPAVLRRIEKRLCAQFRELVQVKPNERTDDAGEPEVERSH